MKEIKIAHFIHDEKFPDSAYRQFEAVFPSASTFYIASNKKELKYIKEIEPVFVSRFSFFSNYFIKNLLKYNLILLHSLNRFNIEIALRLGKYKNGPKIVWIGMGYDYYDLIYPDKNDLFLEKTKELVSRSELHQKKTGYRITSLLNKVARKVVYTNISKHKVLESIGYFSPVLPNEYEILKNVCLSRGFPKNIKWNYATNAKEIDKEDGLIVDRSSKNILLGNSATHTNNHIDIIDFLSAYKCSFDKIVCPLSYGEEWYGAYINNYGKNLFDSKFEAMLGFINYDDYIIKISSCSVVIMNHIRQQAAGNVTAMLNMGATVFLREENPLYDYYKLLGLKLFSIQDLIVDPELLSYRLSNNEVYENKRIIKLNLGWEASLNKTKVLVESVVSD